jgi:hypothetical protein
MEESGMKYFMQWALDEKIILGVLAITFAVLAILLIKWNADTSHVSSFIGLSSLLIGGLIRGIIGPNGGSEPPKQP